MKWIRNKYAYFGSRTRTLHEPTPSITLPPPLPKNCCIIVTFDSASFRLIKSNRASPMNSIGSAGCATTSEVSASDRGSPTVRFKNSASIAAPAAPTVAAILLYRRNTSWLQEGGKRERETERETGSRRRNQNLFMKRRKEFAKENWFGILVLNWF